MKCRFSLMAATAVVPDPMQLSSIKSPSLVYVRIRYLRSSTGFWVGWSLSLSRLKNCTVLGCRKPLSLLVVTSFNPLQLLLVLPFLRQYGLPSVFLRVVFHWSSCAISTSTLAEYIDIFVYSKRLKVYIRYICTMFFLPHPFIFIKVGSNC